MGRELIKSLCPLALCASLEEGKGLCLLRKAFVSCYGLCPVGRKGWGISNKGISKLQAGRHRGGGKQLRRF